MESIEKADGGHKKRKRLSNAPDAALQATKRVKSEDAISIEDGSEGGSEAGKKKPRRGNRQNYRLNSKLKRKQLALHTAEQTSAVDVEGGVQTSAKDDIETPVRTKAPQKGGIPIAQQEEAATPKPEKQKTDKKKKDVKPGACPLPNHEGHREKDCYILHPEVTPKISRKAIKKQEKKERFLAKKAAALEEQKKRKAEGLPPLEKKPKEERQLTKKMRKEKKEKEALLLKEVADIQSRELQIARIESEAELYSDDVADDIPLPVAASHGGSWRTSQPAGGRFLNHDPVFSVDEKHLFLATKRGIHVYSTANSLLVRTLLGNPLDTIAAYALSAINDRHLYVANAAGSIILWDWQTGRQVLTIPMKWPIRTLSVAQIHGTSYDTLFTVETQTSSLEGQVDHIVVRQVRLGIDTTSHTSLWRWIRKDILFLKVLDGGNVIFAACPERLVMGNVSSEYVNTLYSLDGNKFAERYVWREQKSGEALTCLDARARPRPAGHQVDRSNKLGHMSYDLVCGDVLGTTYIYENFLYKMEEREKKKKDEPLAPRIHKWHREAVSTVKWSLDGNYVISGGKETVLVLYQLETGKDQKLPHLTSTILSLTVSPKGVAYAVHLADNSVMVLSTTELKPKANIPGIQSLFISLAPPLLPEAPTITTITRDSDDPVDTFGRTPAASNPQNLNQLFLAVPASQDGTNDSNSPPSAPFLQTFDVFAGRHVTRQALARNLATTANVGPESNRLKEPNVTHLETSADGQWLSTIEEWTPPSTDVEFTVFTDIGLAAERKRRLETYLKFWRWDRELNQWLLETRVDFPHQSKTDPCSNRVFDLVSHPALPGFATIGEDGFVRLWRPKTRMGDGSVLRGAKAEGDITWKCAHAVELENIPAVGDIGQDFPAVPSPTNGKLAYSNDGSILAAAQESLEASKAGLVHFFDAASGTIKYSESTMYADGLVDIGFLGRYFVILSNDVRVWDVVINKLIYGFRLKLPKQLTPKQRLTMSHLAINVASNTFAIAVPTIRPSIEDTSLGLQDVFATVTVFDPSRPDPLIFYDTPSPLTALVSLTGSSGYLVLDAEAEFRTLNPKNSAIFITPAPLREEVQQIEAVKRDDDVDMEDKIDVEEVEAGVEKEEGSEQDEDDMPEDEKVVVRPEQLAGIFERGSSFALPSVKDLFDSVVGLYGRRNAA